MIVFDLAHSNKTHRIAIIGSCRVRTPILTLKSLGELELLINQPALTHSFLEGRQNMRHAWGEARVPDVFAPYIFETDTSPAPEKYPRKILDEVDTVLVEMCDSRQIRKDEWLFQSNYFSRQFVQKHAAELLEWYRAFSKGKEISSELIETTLEKLRVSGAATSAAEDILRNARLEMPDRDKVIEDAKSLAADRSKRWIFLSHFVVEDNHGAIMEDRRRLATYVKDAADAVGAEFFNPSRLLAHYGREKVLRGGGTDIYEYDWDFIPIVGEIILNIIRQGVGADLKLPPLSRDSQTSAKPTSSRAQPDAKSGGIEQSAERINKLLVRLHNDRLKTLGLKNSGLYDHFRTLLEAGQVVRPRDIEVARLLADELPLYANYTVLKAGLGVVPLLLALEGLKSTALEVSGPRVEAINAGISAIAVTRKNVVGKVRAEIGLLPETAEDGPALCVAVGYVSRGAELERERVLDQLAQFDALLIEPRTFLWHRSTVDQADLRDELQGIGFAHLSEVSDGLLFASKNAVALSRQKAQLAGV